MSDALIELRAKIQEFVDQRDWDVFHSPKNLSMALIGEAAEIVEHFQWLDDSQSYRIMEDKREDLEDELADVFIYLIRLADKLDVDLIDAAHRKIDKNNRKYPAEKVRGSAKKYTEYED